MPGGPSLLGLGYFVGVKLVGYTAAGYWLRARCPLRAPPLAFGAARTALGLAVGIAVTSLLGLAGWDRATPLFFLALVPVRFWEWRLTLHWFTARDGLTPIQRSTYALGGIAWSFALDLPAILAVFTIPGGSWVC